MAEPVAAAPAANARQVALQRLYLKDASVEVPLAPQVFNRQWSPEVDVQVGTSISNVGENLYQVVLAVTVTAKLGTDIGFLVEVHQAGIFALTGFASDGEIQGTLGGYCPTIVFPFAREVVADLVQRAGFPQLLLQPINFEALYLEHLARSRDATLAGGPQTLQ